MHDQLPVVKREPCDFCGSPAQVTVAYTEGQPETLACIACATERNIEIGSVFLNGEWQSLAQLLDEVNDGI